jgi:hypothetical protein
MTTATEWWDNEQQPRHVKTRDLRVAIKRLRHAQKKRLAKTFKNRHAKSPKWHRTAARKQCREAVKNIRALAVLALSVGNK